MQQRLTWILTVLALGLLAFIVLYERKTPGSADRKTPPRIFPALEAGAVNAVEITLARGGVVRAEQTNGTWFLTQPLYPAQQSLIETFVTNIAQLRRFDRIPAHEVALQGQKSFGLDPAAATVLVGTATNRLRFEVGGPAPLTNNIYLRLEPSGEVLLAQADVLQAIPRTTNDWRSEKLLPLGKLNFDHLQVRNGQRVFELGKNPTNNLWQLTRPIPARGDQDQIARLFERLGTAEIGRFVADGPVDLEPYNLQGPQVELTFARGTNSVFRVEFGGSDTNETNAVYARLVGNTNIVTVSADLVEILRKPYKAFHDPRLFSFNPNTMNRVVVRSIETFPLERQSDGNWEAGEKEPFLADRELVTDFLRTILSMRILDIAKEVPTEADLQSLGLMQPRVSYSFFEHRTNANGVGTNILLSELSFGSNLTDRIYVRRSDETPVYITELAPLLELPHQAFRLKDRQIWSFRTNDLVRITMKSAGATNSAIRSNTGWVTDLVANAVIEEMAFRLSQLRAVRWVGKGEDVARMAGISAQSQTLELEIKSPDGPQILGIAFGKAALHKNVYATRFPAEAESVVFEFPAEIYHLLNQNLPAAK